jgi:nucleotide-binding universal stress UspA family protein
MAPNFQHILLPTDFSDTARPAIEYAQMLTSTFGSQLHCLHVVDDAFQYWTAVGPESLPMGPPPDELIELGRTRMARFCQEFLQGLAKPVISHVTYGRPFAEIINYAREQSIGVIVMGTHGRGALAHALLGSTTEKVVRKAPCAVLTVRTSDPACGPA